LAILVNNGQFVLAIYIRGKVGDVLPLGRRDREGIVHFPTFLCPYWPFSAILANIGQIVDIVHQGPNACTE
jgi:hypothetical protein